MLCSKFHHCTHPVLMLLGEVMYRISRSPKSIIHHVKTRRSGGRRRGICHRSYPVVIQPRLRRSKLMNPVKSRFSMSSLSVTESISTMVSSRRLVIWISKMGCRSFKLQSSKKPWPWWSFNFIQNDRVRSSFGHLTSASSAAGPWPKLYNIRVCTGAVPSSSCIECQ